MPDREKVIKEFEHLLNAARGNYQDFVDLTVDGGDEILALLKEQEALLNKAYELLADMELDIWCDDLMCDDGWCDEHCTTNGPMPECIERWMRKQIAEGR